MADASSLVQALQRGGYSRAGAAGIVGNLQQESSLNPNAPGGGLAQWIGPRQTALQQFAAAQRRPANDPAVQVGFLMNELRTQYPQLNQFLRTTNDPQAAALAVSRQYERPGVPMNQNRVSYAVAAFGGKPPTGGGLAPLAAPSGDVSLTVPQTVPTFDQAGYKQAMGRYIAGSALKASSGSGNPYSGSPGTSKGFAASLGGSGNPLFSTGLLTTTAPNRQDFAGTKTVNQTFKVAQNSLQQIAGGTSLAVHPGAHSGAGYVNPLPGFKLGRTDQGVDASAAPGTPIRAIGDSRLVQTVPGWYAGQPLLLFQFLNGPKAGQYWYLAEQISPRVRTGEVVHAGDPVATYAPSGTGIEIGYGDPRSGGRTLAQAQGNTGDASHGNAPAGIAFRQFLGSLGAR